MKKALGATFGASFVSLIMAVSLASPAMAATDDPGAAGDVSILAFKTETMANGCKIQGGNGHGTSSPGTHWPWGKTEMKNSTCERIRAYVYYKRKSDGTWIGQFAPVNGAWTSQNEIRVTANYAASTYSHSGHGARVRTMTGDWWTSWFKLTKDGVVTKPWTPPSG